MRDYPRQLEILINELSKLPGVGEKSAQRLAFHILDKDEKQVEALAESMLNAKRQLKHCSICGNLTDSDPCKICSDPGRRKDLICVVETPRDLMAMERIRDYNGTYHVLHGVISPMDGIGPQDLEIDSLLERIHQEDLKELIFALSPTMEGDTTAFYIYRRMGDITIQTTTLARGVAQNDQLQYTDELTLGRSLLERRPFNQT